MMRTSWNRRICARESLLTRAKDHMKRQNQPDIKKEKQQQKKAGVGSNCIVTQEDDQKG